MFEERGSSPYFVVSRQTGANHPQLENTPRERLQHFAHVLQPVLFERMEMELGALPEKARQLVAVLAMVPLGRWLGATAGLAAAFLPGGP